jgi:hypothetical protein
MQQRRRANTAGNWQNTNRQDYKIYQDRLRRSERRYGRLGEGTSTATTKYHAKDGSIQMSARTDKEHGSSQGNGFVSFVSPVS